MQAMGVLAMVCVGGGMALGTVGMLSRSRGREAALAELLDLPYPPPEVPLAQLLEEHGTLVSNTIGLTTKVVEQMDPRGGLRLRLERAKVPLRPAEFVLVVAGCGVAAALLLAAVCDTWIVGLALMLALSRQLPKADIHVREGKWER